MGTQQLSKPQVKPKRRYLTYKAFEKLSKDTKSFYPCIKLLAKQCRNIKPLGHAEVKYLITFESQQISVGINIDGSYLTLKRENGKDVFIKSTGEIEVM